jgi:diguanylate cyclase (GGDEF)-like protein
VTLRRPSANDRPRTHARPHDRDRSADERDRAADERDRAADERDRAADERDRAARVSSTDDLEAATRERWQAAADRAEAARDRMRAARDRMDAARDRARAGVDALTGALRRERGLGDLQREIDRARRSDGRLVVAFVDVDGLKTVNDAEGHAAGDRLLRDVGTALRAGLRSYDLVIRYGGDEFVCALPGVDAARGRRRFDDVKRKLTETNASASVSIGLTELEDVDTLDDVLARADAALYADAALVGSRRARKREAAS